MADHRFTVRVLAMMPVYADIEVDPPEDFVEDMTEEEIERLCCSFVQDQIEANLDPVEWKRVVPEGTPEDDDHASGALLSSLRYAATRRA